MRAGENWKGEPFPPHVATFYVSGCIKKIYLSVLFWFFFLVQYIVAVSAFAQSFLNSIKGTDDASKILSNDGACPICDQVLSKR